VVQLLWIRIALDFCGSDSVFFGGDLDVSVASAMGFFTRQTSADADPRINGEVRVDDERTGRPTRGIA